jgi:adenylate cyclase
MDDAPRLADAAIALRERCSALFGSDEGSAAFGLGLDVGSVNGDTLGAAPGLFNLWGEAVQGAGALASSAPADAIQTSEQAYLLLRQGFLFRPRGLFHRPRIGEVRSYVLAGRA